MLKIKRGILMYIKESKTGNQVIHKRQGQPPGVNSNCPYLSSNCQFKLSQCI